MPAMKPFKFVERYFWAFHVTATLLGVFAPALCAPLRPLAKVFLGGILFFTGLKLDFRAAWKELARPGLIIYAAIMMLVVLPLAVWGMALLALPEEFAAGVLIVAAMPAGLAGASLADIAKGNAALALVVTLVTSLACPLVAPWVIEMGTGQAAGAGWSFLGEQAAFLAVILFVPMAAAYLVRRTVPRTVERHRESYTGLAMISLSLLILAAVSGTSEDIISLLCEQPGRAAALAGVMVAFSALLHLAGYFLAPWRPAADRAALSVNAAYVNNGLAIVFAIEFFKPLLGAAAVLPAIFLEIPMVLAILPLRAWVTRRGRDPGPT